MTCHVASPARPPPHAYHKPSCFQAPTLSQVCRAGPPSLTHFRIWGGSRLPDLFRGPAIQPLYLSGSSNPHQGPGVQPPNPPGGSRDLTPGMSELDRTARLKDQGGGPGERPRSWQGAGETPLWPRSHFLRNGDKCYPASLVPKFTGAQPAWTDPVRTRPRECLLLPWGQGS